MTINKSETISKLAIALVKAQIEIKTAHKDASNPYFKSKYADLVEIVSVVKEPLNKQGIAFLQIVTADGVETMLLHESGEFISGTTPVIVAKPNDPQALGSAITYARRYGLQSIVGVVAELDDDGEKAMGRTADPRAVKTAPVQQSNQAPRPIPSQAPNQAPIQATNQAPRPMPSQAPNPAPRPAPKPVQYNNDFNF